MSTTQLTHYQPFLSVTPPKSAVSDRYDRKIADSRAAGFRFIGFTGARIQIHRIHSRLDSDSQDSQPAGVGFRILAGGLLPRLGMPRRRPLESWASSGILGPRIDHVTAPTALPTRRASTPFSAVKCTFSRSSSRSLRFARLLGTPQVVAQSLPVALGMSTSLAATRRLQACVASPA